MSSASARSSGSGPRRRSPGSRAPSAGSASCCLPRPSSCCRGRALPDRPADLDELPLQPAAAALDGHALRRASRTTPGPSGTTASGKPRGTRRSTSSSPCRARPWSGWAWRSSPISPSGSSGRCGSALLLPWALPLVFPGLIFRWFFDYSLGHRQQRDRAPRRLGEVLADRPDPRLHGHLPRHRLEDVELRRAGAARGAPDDPGLALRGGRDRRRDAVAAVPGGHAADAPARHRGGAHLPHHHGDPDLRHPLRHDQRRPGNSTETLAMYVHKTTIDSLDFGYGSALAVLDVRGLGLATAGYLRYIRRDPRAPDGARATPPRHGLARRADRGPQRLLPRALDPR